MTAPTPLDTLKNAEWLYQVARREADAAWTEYALDDEPDPAKLERAEKLDAIRNRAWDNRELAYIEYNEPDAAYLQNIGK